MGRAGITYNDVVNAATELQGQNQNPTVDNVRALLGTGSKSTIAPHLKQWKQQQAGDGISLEAASIPSEMLSLLKGLWERLQEQAQVKIDEIKATKQTELVAAQNEYHALKTSHESTLNDYNALQADHEKLQAKLAQVNKDHASLFNQLARTQADNATLTARIEDQQKASQQVHDHLNHLQTSYDNYQQAIADKQQKMQLDHDKQSSEYEQSIHSLRLQLDEAKQQNYQLLTTNEQLNSQNSEFEKQQSKLNNVNQNLELRFAKQAATLDKLQAKYDALDESHLTLRNAHDQLKQGNHHLDKQLALLSQEKEQHLTHLTNSENIIAQLQHENQFLNQEKSTLSQQLTSLQPSESA